MSTMATFDVETVTYPIIVSTGDRPSAIIQIL